LIIGPFKLDLMRSFGHFVVHENFI
jgi:hypothetical protein